MLFVRKSSVLDNLCKTKKVDKEDTMYDFIPHIFNVWLPDFQILQPTL